MSEFYQLVVHDRHSEALALFVTILVLEVSQGGDLRLC